MLKKGESLTVRSAHYHKQSPFKGSNRELRGRILRMLLERSPVSEDGVIQHLNQDAERVRTILRQLHKEGFITISGDRVSIR